MAEYITKAEALHAVEDAMELTSSEYDMIAEKIDNVPAADVVPVVHARWDDIPNAYMSVVSKTGTYHGNATTCSACREINPNAFKTNYCPNCGAKMAGGANNG